MLVRPARFELATFRFGGGRSIQLSYGRAALSLLHATARALLFYQRHRGLDQILSPFNPCENSLQVKGRLRRIAIRDAVNTMLPDENKRIRKHIKRNRKPTPLRSQHKLMLL